MRHNFEPNEIFDPYFLQSVVQHATYLLKADGSGFYSWHADMRQPTLLAKYNLTYIPWDDALPQRVIRSQSVVVETFPSRPALLAVPTSLHEDICGTLVVADWDPARRFTEHDIAMLESLADLAASASRQTQRLARMTAQFRALHAIDIALTSSLQLERVLNLILEKAVELVGAEHGSLRQLKPETGELILRAHYGDGWTAEKLAYTPRVGEGIAQWVAENRRPYLNPDVRKDPRYVVLFEDMRSSVAVPLLGAHGNEDPVAEQFLGVLLLESSRTAAFDQQDVELLDALAQEAVIAIQNATQHQRLRAMHQELKDEQEKRLAAEQWTVMGQAATSLAHRINNIIGTLPASANEVRRTLTAAKVADEDRKWIDANLSRIERNSGFILKLVDALFRPFKEAGPLRRLDVNQLLNEALGGAELPSVFEVLRDFESDLPKVESNALLVDIFLELIVNAKKAMQSTAVKQLRIQSRSEVRDGSRWVVVVISDTGNGIPPERMANMWEMFQQSKNGLGFGLWWLRTFIVRQGGMIDCTSKQGEGTTFTVRLPAVAER
ncbi:MAG: GAF domain-containing protein [Deltaproteobacteria bacterium]|nr:GAF domain-containing protein [Deltaproteobacteria bacterium]MBW2152548.1 GAF domain-containing protein [Deltaproteobacteria bacterium]